jgi:hypothetical protein
MSGEKLCFYETNRSSNTGRAGNRRGITERHRLHGRGILAAEDDYAEQQQAAIAALQRQVEEVRAAQEATEWQAKVERDMRNSQAILMVVTKTCTSRCPR